MWLIPVIYLGGAIYKYTKIDKKDKHPISGALLWPLGIFGGSGPFAG